MYTTNRYIPAFGAIAVAVLALTACGGGSGVIVARVAGVGSISKASLEHWMTVEAVVLYQEFPTKPAPKGVVPDPPTYTACIAYLRTSRQRLIENRSKPTAGQLKHRCEQRYAELRVLTLNTLIGWYWRIGAGMALGMKASDAEAKQRLEEVSKRAFPKRSAFANYLKITGQTVSDMLFRSRVQLLEVKIAQKLADAEKLLPPGLTAQQRQSALVKFTKNSPEKWAAKTSCRSGYVVSACKEYRGSEPPGVPN